MKKNYFTTAIIYLAIAGPAIGQTTLSGILPCNQTLALSGSPYTATANITVAQGCVLNVDPGVEIKMAENTHLIIRGKANFMGTSSQPIHIHAVDTIWGNIMLDSTMNQKSSFNYVTIENARQSVKLSEEPGAIYGFYSNFEAKNCHFKNNLRCVSNYKCPNFLVKDCILDSTNRGEKIHGQYCNGAIVDGNILYATRGDNDEIDFDASNNVTITNNRLYSGGDDAIDIGQCDSIGCDTVLIAGNYMMNMFNKGVSNGEYCLNITIHHNVIGGCAMGIGAKSGAHVIADHNTIYSCKMGIESYEHLNQIWGPGHLTVTNCIVANCDTTYHVDPTAYLAVSYTLADDTIIPGTGNIKGNPAFVAPATTMTGDFHLTSASAAIDKGDPGYTLDSDGTRSDMGAYFFSHTIGFKTNSISSGTEIFPNPSNGIFYLSLKEQDVMRSGEKITLRVLNVNGQSVHSENISPDSFTNKYEVNTGKQPAGTYYLQLITDERIFVNKLIIK
ncbi:MAG: T9SS type A sorting domain-containing protein [Bacteroidia bacterium]